MEVLLLVTMNYGVDNMFRIEHDVATGEIKEIELTSSEIKAIEKLQKETLEKNAIIEAEVEAKLAEKAALLERLGITAEEAKLLLS
jgi:Asp-tRNA(Asn)/Glu-tRNA(Gln) amidotransferase A subunit family amidase